MPAVTTPTRSCTNLGETPINGLCASLLNSAAILYSVTLLPRSTCSATSCVPAALSLVTTLVQSSVFSPLMARILSPVIKPAREAACPVIIVPIIGSLEGCSKPVVTKIKKNKKIGSKIFIMEPAKITNILDNIGFEEKPFSTSSSPGSIPAILL